MKLGRGASADFTSIRGAEVVGGSNLAEETPSDFGSSLTAGFAAASGSFEVGPSSLPDERLIVT